MASRTRLGSGLPLVGAYPAEREAIGRDLASGADAHAVFDLRLSGNLAHEICHGPLRAGDGPAAPWLIIESAALHLGSIAFRRHVFPEVAGEAIPGVAPFVLVGEALARLFGRRALWRAGTEVLQRSERGRIRLCQSDFSDQFSRSSRVCADERPG